MFALSAWAQTATVVAGLRGEGDALASLRSVDVSSNSHRGSGHDKLGRCCGLSSLGRRGLSQLLWWPARYVMAILWPLLALPALAQPANTLAGMKVEGAVMLYVRFVGVSSARHCVGKHEK
jgi:hypothetical protein